MSTNDKEPSSVNMGAPTLELARELEPGPWAIEVGSPGRTESFPLSQDACLTLGSGVRADIRVDDRTVSSRHARLSATSNGVRVEDLDSRNGVHVGGARVHDAWLVGDRSTFVIGQTTVTVTPLQDHVEESPHAESICGLVGSSPNSSVYSARQIVSISNA